MRSYPHRLPASVCLADELDPPEVVVDHHPLSVVVVYAGIVEPHAEDVRHAARGVEEAVALVHLLLCNSGITGSEGDGAYQRQNA